MKTKWGIPESRARWLAVTAQAVCAAIAGAEPGMDSALAQHFTSLHYNANDLELTVQLQGKKNEPVLFRGVPPATNQAFLKSENPLAYYQRQIEPVFSTRPLIPWEGRNLIPLKSNVFEGTAYNESAQKLYLLWKNGHAGTFHDISPAIFDRFLSDRYKAAFYQTHIMDKYVKPGSPAWESERLLEQGIDPKAVRTPSAAGIKEPEDEAEVYLQDLLAGLDEPGASDDLPNPDPGPPPEPYKLLDLFAEVADWKSSQQSASPRSARPQNLALYLLQEFQHTATPGPPEPETAGMATNAVPDPELIIIGLSEQEKHIEGLVVNPLDTRILPQEDLEGLLSALESEKQSRWSNMPSRVATNPPRPRAETAAPDSLSIQPPAYEPGDTGPPAEALAADPSDRGPDHDLISAVPPPGPSATGKPGAETEFLKPAVLITATSGVDYEEEDVRSLGVVEDPDAAAFLKSVPPPSREELEMLLEEVIQTSAHPAAPVGEHRQPVVEEAPPPRQPAFRKKKQGLLHRMFGGKKDKPAIKPSSENPAAGTYDPKVGYLFEYTPVDQ